MLRKYSVGFHHFRFTSDLHCAVLSLPLELFLEIFSYLTEHRDFIRENYYGRKMYVRVGREHAERSITIRRLTMTCWPLRNRLLPLLWADTEGCISHARFDYETKSGGALSHLYAQCVYLALNPTIAAYVRYVLSFIHNQLCFTSSAFQDLFCRSVFRLRS